MNTHLLQVIRAAAGRVVKACAVLLLTIGPVIANVNVTAMPTYPASVTVGVPYTASIAITNASTAPDDRAPVSVYGIVHIPACADNGDGVCLQPDLGVFHIADPVGRADTACANRHFTAMPAYAGPGEIEMVSDQDVVLGPSKPGGRGAACIIDFTVTVARVPAIDVDAAAAGIQTFTLALVGSAGAVPTAGLSRGFKSGNFGTAEVTVKPSRCADASPLLGAAKACTVLQTGSDRPGQEKVSIAGPAGALGGDLCIGPGSKLAASGGSVITGDVVLDMDAPAHPTATCSSKAPGIPCAGAQVRDLAPEIGACAALATLASGKPCTIGDYGKSLSAIAGSARLIVGMPGENVVCVKEINVGKDEVIVLTGAPGTTFIVNVKNKFTVNGGKIKTDGTNVKPADVVYNALGSGERIAFSGNARGEGCCSAEIDGSLVAAGRDLDLNPGRINGATCGDGTLSLDGGSSVCMAPAR